MRKKYLTVSCIIAGSLFCFFITRRPENRLSSYKGFESLVYNRRSDDFFDSMKSAYVMDKSAYDAFMLQKVKNGRIEVIDNNPTSYKQFSSGREGFFPKYQNDEEIGHFYEVLAKSKCMQCWFVWQPTGDDPKNEGELYVYSRVYDRGCPPSLTQLARSPQNTREVSRGSTH